LGDRIIVLHDGRIVQVGSHADLARREGLYARWYEAQRLVPQNDVEPTPERLLEQARFGTAEGLA
jgi:ABC-type hemin transport system ATPase subunit